VLSVTWRNLLARKVRLVLSALAIVLGVAFVAGSFIFTDAMGGTFDDIIAGSTADVEIAPKGANDFNSVQDTRTIPAAVVRKLEDVPGVESVHPQVQLQGVYIIDAEGELVGGNGPPGFASNYTGTRSVTGKPVITLAEGRFPDAPYEVAFDVPAAEKANYDVGDTVKLATPGKPPVIEAKLVGLVEFGGGSGTSGATLSILDRKFLQDQFFDGRDVYSTVSLNIADGYTQAEVRDAVQKVLPKDVEARTGDDYVAENQAALDEILGFIQTFLLVFAGVSLVVGIFMIINTFSILVAQRSRELALLRTMGASRRQITWSVVLEAAAVGLIGSTIGLGVGYLLARGLAVLFGLFGLDLSQAGFPVEWTTVLWAYVVGMLVTIIASWLPARRASRIPPIQALRDDIALPETALHRRLITGAVLIVLGVGSISGGFVIDNDASTSLSLIGLGMLLVLVGTALVSPIAARPVISLFRPPYEKGFGSVGRLATQNSLRNPRRTAATASALMVGLALVAMMSVLGRSAAASTEVAVNKNLTSQLIVSNAISTPFSTDVAAQIRRVPGVAAVAALRYGEGDLAGTHIWGAAVDAQDFAEAMRVPVQAGSFAALGHGGIVISHSLSERAGLGLGETAKLEMQGGTVPVKVVAIISAAGAVPAEALVSFDTFAKGALAPLDSMVYVREAPDADPAAVRAAIEKITEDLPTVTVKDPQGYADEQKGQIDQFLNLIYGLLGLSVIIAILGVVNTLGLSVIERTREIGLLRAVGMSRRQLRTMVRLESVVVAIFGALLGIGLGLAFGIGLITALKDQGLTELSIPWVRLAVFVVLAGVVGVISAAVPARRAANLDVLQAIATE